MRSTAIEHEIKMTGARDLDEESIESKRKEHISSI